MVAAVLGAAALLVLGGVLGMLSAVSPANAAAAAFGALFFVLSFRSPATGLAIFIPLTFFELGVYAVGSATLVESAGGALALACLLRIVRDGWTMPILLRPHPFLSFAALALVALSFASMLWAAEVDTAQSTSVRLAQNVVLMFVAFTAIADVSGLRRVLAGFVIGAMLTTAVGVAKAPGPVTGVGGDRLRGGGVDPNELAAMLVPALAIAALWVVATRRLSVRVLGVASVLALTAGICITQSRGGLLALAVALLAAIAVSARRRAYALAVALLIVGLGFSYYKYVAPPEQFQRITDFSTDRGSGRLDIWSVARDVVRDRPGLGVGAGNFRAVEPGYAVHTFNIFNVNVTFVEPRAVHNTYLEVLVELGPGAAAVFLAIILTALVALGRAIRLSRRFRLHEHEFLGRGVLVGSLGMLVALAFISGLYEKQLWLLLGTALACRTVAVRRIREAATAAGEIGPARAD